MNEMNEWKLSHNDQDVVEEANFVWSKDFTSQTQTESQASCKSQICHPVVLNLNLVWDT